MTDKKTDAAPSSAGRKPSALIDLKATVVEATSKPSVETRAAFAGSAAKPAEAQKVTGAVPPTAAPAKPDVSASFAAAAKAAAASSAAQPPPMATAAQVQAQNRAGGLLRMLGAGIVGGALSLLAAAQLAPHLLATGATGSVASDARIADLEQKLAKLGAPVATGAVDARIAKLEEAAQALANGQVKIATELKAVDEKAAKATPVGVPSDQAERLVKLEEQLAQITAAAGDPRSGRIPQIAQITTKVGDLETQFGRGNAQLKTELTQQMDQRFTRSAEALETVRSTLSSRTQSVEQQLKSALDSGAALRTDMDTVKLDLDKRFAAAAKPADVQTAVASVATKVTSLEQTMQGVAKSEAERNQTAGNILLSLELANLKRALDRGGKYASELAAVKGLAGPKLDLRVLEASQTTGVPNLATLGQELAAIAHGMLDAEAEPANASVTDRLLSGVKSIVRVRKVDFAPGDNGTEALIARMEQALKEGRLADVLDESKKLSPKAAEPAVKWLDRIKGRAAIDAVLASLDASLKTSLAGGAAPKKAAN